jgi:hypothetical protein
LQRIFCQASCRSLQVFCRFFAGRLQTFQTFRRSVVTSVCNGLTIWSCTFFDAWIFKSAFAEVFPHLSRVSCKKQSIRSWQCL